MEKYLTYPYRAYQFFVGGLRYQPSTLFALLFSFIKPTSPISAPKLNDTELMEALKAGKSLIRFGDGEAMLMMGRDIHYQKFNPALAKGLYRAVSEYNKNAPYIVGIPTIELAMTETELRNNKRLRIWRLFRVFYPRTFPSDSPYAYYVLFYKKNAFEHQVAPVLKERHIICVSNEKVLDSSLRNYLREYFKSADFVTTPSRNAFDQMNSITSEIDTHLSRYDKSLVTILLAAGPASKVIAYQYANRGVQALDVGHGMEIIARNLDYSSRI